MIGQNLNRKARELLDFQQRKVKLMIINVFPVLSIAENVLKHSYTSTTGTRQLNRVVTMFSDFVISVQWNEIPSISLLHILGVVMMIFYGKFHPYNLYSPLIYPFELNNRYWISTLFITSAKLLQLEIIYSTLNKFQ